MKELNIYLEGLLNKPGKSSISSTKDAIIDELNELYIKPLLCGAFSRNNKSLNVDIESNKLIISYANKGAYISGKVLSNMINYIADKSYALEVVFNIDQVIIICNDNLDFRKIPMRFKIVKLKSNIGYSNILYMNKMNVNCDDFHIEGSIIVQDFDIKTQNIFVLRNDKPFNAQYHANLKFERIIFLTEGSFNSGNKLEYLDLAFRDNTDITYKPLYWSDKNKLKKLNPSSIFSLNKFNVPQIIITRDIDSHSSTLVFTKKLKKYKTIEYHGQKLTQEESVIELSDGWYAVWTLFSKSLLK